MSCIYCNREITNKGSLKAHEMCCKQNPFRVKHNRSPFCGHQKGCIPWNTGLKDDPRCAKSEETKQKIREITTGKGSTPEREQERIRKIKEKAKLSNGGYRKGSGRGKSGWYKGFYCDSSWELAYVIYCLDNSIDIKRNKERRSYEWDGRSRNYIPDFVVDGVLIEVKGYKTEQWLAKLAANPDVKVLYEVDLQPILDYVRIKYGKDYINMYEKEVLAESA